MQSILKDHFIDQFSKFNLLPNHLLISSSFIFLTLGILARLYIVFLIDFLFVFLFKLIIMPHKNDFIDLTCQRRNVSAVVHTK